MLGQIKKSFVFKSKGSRVILRQNSDIFQASSTQKSKWNLGAHWQLHVHASIMEVTQHIKAILILQSSSLYWTFPCRQTPCLIHTITRVTTIFLAYTMYLTHVIHKLIPEIWKLRLHLLIFLNPFWEIQSIQSCSIDIRSFSVHNLQKNISTKAEWLTGFIFVSTGTGQEYPNFHRVPK